MEGEGKRGRRKGEEEVKRGEKDARGKKSRSIGMPGVRLAGQGEMTIAKARLKRK